MSHRQSSTGENGRWFLTNSRRERKKEKTELHRRLNDTFCQSLIMWVLSFEVRARAKSILSVNPLTCILIELFNFSSTPANKHVVWNFFLVIVVVVSTCKNVQLTKINSLRNHFPQFHWIKWRFLWIKCEFSLSELSAKKWLSCESNDRHEKTKNF